MLSILVPVLLGWFARIVMLQIRESHDVRSLSQRWGMRIGNTLCLLGGMFTWLLWLSQQFTHAACLMAGFFLFGPGLCLITFFIIKKQKYDTDRVIHSV